MGGPADRLLSNSRLVSGLRTLSPRRHLPLAFIHLTPRFAGLPCEAYIPLFSLLSPFSYTYRTARLYRLPCDRYPSHYRLVAHPYLYARNALQPSVLMPMLLAPSGSTYICFYALVMIVQVQSAICRLLEFCCASHGNLRINNLDLRVGDVCKFTSSYSGRERRSYRRSSRTRN